MSRTFRPANAAAVRSAGGNSVSHCRTPNSRSTPSCQRLIQRLSRRPIQRWNRKRARQLPVRPANPWRYPRRAPQAEHPHHASHTLCGMRRKPRGSCVRPAVVSMDRPPVKRCGNGWGKTASAAIRWCGAKVGPSGCWPAMFLPTTTQPLSAGRRPSRPNLRRRPPWQLLPQQLLPLQLLRLPRSGPQQPPTRLLHQLPYRLPARPQAVLRQPRSLPAAIPWSHLPAPQLPLPPLQARSRGWPASSVGDGTTVCSSPSYWLSCSCWLSPWCWFCEIKAAPLSRRWR